MTYRDQRGADFTMYRRIHYFLLGISCFFQPKKSQIISGLLVVGIVWQLNLQLQCTYYTTYIYHHEFESRSWRGVLDTTLRDKVCQRLAEGRWFSSGTAVSSTNKTGRHDRTEILLKVPLNTTTLIQIIPYSVSIFIHFNEQRPSENIIK